MSLESAHSSSGKVAFKCIHWELWIYFFFNLQEILLKYTLALFEIKLLLHFHSATLPYRFTGLCFPCMKSIGDLENTIFGSECLWKSMCALNFNWLIAASENKCIDYAVCNGELFSPNNCSIIVKAKWILPNEFRDVAFSSMSNSLNNCTPNTLMKRNGNCLL